MLNTFKSEWTKLVTTRSFWWTTIVFFFFSWGWALLNAKASDESMPFDLGAPVVVLFMLAMPVLLIQAIMVVTTEYRYGVQTNVYMATPTRWKVAIVKLVLYAVIAAAFTALAVAGAYLVAQGVLTGLAKESFDPWGSDAGKRQLWIYPLAMALLVLFGQGLGLLLRQTAGTVAISLILYLGLDQLVQAIPKVGEKIGPYMPFTSFQNWLYQSVPAHAPWDSASVSGWIFVAWALGLWVLGLVALVKRDV